MTRALLIAAGTLAILGPFLLDEVLDSKASDIAKSKLSRQIRLAADPSLKYISEDNPYMRSER